MRGVLTELDARGIKLGILTSNSKKNVNKFLINQKLDMFIFVDNSGLFGKESKLKKTMKRYGLNSEDILYVGDEIRDIFSTKHVGVDIAAVDWGYNDSESLKKNNPKYLISDPEKLIEICFGKGEGNE
jgi:phosphoglycolate phosphatase-like HAD superfamily hydrolase